MTLGYNIELRNFVTNAFKGVGSFENNYFGLEEVKEFWSKAVYYNSIQNESLSGGYTDDVMTCLMIKKNGYCQSISIESGAKLTRKEYLVLLMSCDRMYLSFEETIKLVGRDFLN